MKLKLNFVIVIVLLSILYLSISKQTNAQAPQKFNYQGIARDESGKPLSNKALNIKLSILAGADFTIPEYEETQSITTNEFGLYTLQIGNGISAVGDMKTVTWETGNKYIKVAIDPNGGTNFKDMGTSQLLSVPYALYADKSGYAKESSHISDGTRTGAVNSSAAHVAGDANYISKFTGLNTIGKSLLYDNGSGIGLGTLSPLTKFHLYNTSTSNTELRIQHTNTLAASRLSFMNDTSNSFGSNTNYAIFNKFGSGVTGQQANNFLNAKLFSLNNSQGALLFSSGDNIGFGFFTQPSSVLNVKLLLHKASNSVGIGGNIVPSASVHINNLLNGDTLKISNAITGHLVNDGLNIITTGNKASIINNENSTLSFGTNALTRLTIDSIGNTGIGTLTPSAKLDVNGQVKITGGSPGVGKVLTSDASGLAVWQSPATFSESDPQVNSSVVNVIPKWNGSALIDGSITDNGSNIGIGTSSPSAKLEVNGQVKITGGSPGLGKVLTSDASGLASWQNGIPGPQGPQGPIGPTGATGPAGGISSITAGAGLSGGTITTSGIIAIANTGAIAGTYGSSTDIPVISVNSRGQITSASNITFNELDPTVDNVVVNAVAKWNGTHLTDGIIFDNGTNIGIGTALPSAKLDIAGQIKIGGGTPGLAKVLTSDANGLATWEKESDPEVDVTTTTIVPKWNGTKLVNGMIYDGGNAVGIGNSSPAYKLDILGQCKATAGAGYAAGVFAGGINCQANTGYAAGTFNGAVHSIGVPAGYYGLTTDRSLSVDEDADVFGTLWAGFLTGSVKAFTIDHPLDPENKYLRHSSIESPDMLNIYNGNIITDANGEAIIQLPDYFEALNKDFKYQLTVIDDQQFAQARVAKKINNNQFSIKTDKPFIEISWQVSGVRHDAVANSNRIVVEELKSNKDQGKYVNPQAFGKPKSLQIQHHELSKTLNNHSVENKN